MWITTQRLLMFFFFSSRRRHTRSDRDWSSDVCSSDLSFVTWPTSSTATPALLAARMICEATSRTWPKIGRASCRERVEITVVDVVLKKKESRIRSDNAQIDTSVYVIHN